MRKIALLLGLFMGFTASSLISPPDKWEPSETTNPIPEKPASPSLTDWRAIPEYGFTNRLAMQMAKQEVVNQKLQKEVSDD